MKLHLPLNLLRAMVLVMGVAAVQAAVRHTDVSTFTYVDFATNSGRYVAGTTNALLDEIRRRDGGVKIEHTGNQSAYILPHEMISFDSVSDMGNTTVIGYNYVVTVAHNASQMFPTFSRNEYGIGEEKSIKYMTVDEYGDSKTFVHHIFHSADDYKVARLTKLVTDATPVQMTGGAGTDYKGELVYRVGGGKQYLRDENGTYDESIQDVYLVGGVAGITDWSQSVTDENIRVGVVQSNTSWKKGAGAGEGTPMPFGGEEGDSGSPYFVWEGDDATGSYKFLMAHRASDKNSTTEGQEACEWTQTVIQNDSFCVDMSKVSGALNINGAEIEKDDEKGGLSDVINGVSVTATVARGFLSDQNGNLYDKNWNSSFKAVETGGNTWKSLSDLKNSDTWYAYGNEFLNATASTILDSDKNWQPATGLTYSQLFQTQNLVFEAAADNAAYTINVTKDTDLGAGYLHFAANGKKDVTFQVNEAGSNQLNSAGYVVDAGVQVNVKLRNADAGYMREWRKVGEGTLNICGNGNNEIFLNVGGTGKTLLNQEDGYAAYNVLVNTGSTVRIKNTDQIYRDLTFGNGGGTLDMNGNTMEWYLSGGESRDGFTINALTEEAVIANSSAVRAELIFKEEGSTTFAGSFRDSGDSALGITYAGGGTWELNGIRTSLTNDGSGLTVKNGTVKLAGTLTVHGYGTTHTKETADFTVRENDWHYADATMNVTVEKGAIFELESHARLTGTVTVQEGGKYIMHEGVQHDYEYIEGGEKLESTAAIKDYYGHKGDVKLAKDATLSWQRGSKEVASLKGNSASGSLAGVETTIASESHLCLAAAGHEPGQITAADLTLHGGVRLSLNNLHVDAASSITSGGVAFVDMHDATLLVTMENSVQESAGLSDSLQLVSAGGSESVSLESGMIVWDIQSDVLNGSLTISGSMLTVDFTALGEVFADAIRLQFGEDVSFAGLEEMRLVGITANGEMAGFYDVNNSSVAYFTLIPEPATTTLSLLALTALAARRRRK